MKQIVLWLPGALANPQSSTRGGTWHKRARLARSIRERVALHVLAAVPGRRIPWPAELQKVVVFRAHVHSEFDSDNIQGALKPYRDGLIDAKLIHDDRPSARHLFVYYQQISRGKDAKRGVEITVTTLEETP